MKFLLILILLLSPNLCNSQTNYVVVEDNFTGSFSWGHYNSTTGLSSGLTLIEGLGSINTHEIGTFDESNNLLIFVGEELGTFINYTYVIDVETGLVNKYPFNSHSIHSLKYDRNSGNIYCLVVNNTTGNFHFASFDSSNGGVTELLTLSTLSTLDYVPATIDLNNNKYLFIGDEEGTSNYYLYSIDLTTLSLTSFLQGSPYFINLLEYDANSQSVHCIVEYEIASIFYYGKLNSLTGGITDETTVSDLAFTENYISNFDESNNRFLFIGQNNLGEYYVYSIHTTTGTIDQFSILPDIPYIMEYSPSLVSSGENLTSDDNILVYPVPNNGEFWITFSTDQYLDIAFVELVDINGVVVDKYFLNDGVKNYEINTSLASGTYFLKYKNDNQLNFKQIEIIK